MIFNLLSKIVDVIVLHPFQSKVVGSSAVIDVIETPSVKPEDNNPNWSQERVKDRFPPSSVVSNHGSVEEVPFVLDDNFEGDTGPEIVIRIRG